MLTRQMIINVDDASQMQTNTSPTIASLTVWRGTEYLVQCFLQQSLDNTNNYALDNSFLYTIAVGDVYGAGANPIIQDHGSTGINDPTMWSNVAPSQGRICFALNTNSTMISADLGSQPSKSYTLQIFAWNSSTQPFILCSSTITINNVIVDPVEV